MSSKAAEKSYAGQFAELKCIGRGKFGTVYLVRSLSDNQLYVAKKIVLDGLSEKEIEVAFNEVPCG